METIAEPIPDRVPNRYSLVVLAAKRAKQIKEGAPPLIATDSTNALTIALEEISAGKINYIEAPEIVDDEMAHTAAPVIAATPAPPTAMQLLTESLDEAERAASLLEEESQLEAEDDGDDTGDEAAADSNDDYLVAAGVSAEEE